MAYVVLTVAQATAQAERIQSRLNAEVQRVGAAMVPPWAPPAFSGFPAVFAQSTCRVVVDTGDDDTPGTPKTICVIWRDPADPPKELWVLHLWGPSNRRLALFQFVCQGIIATFDNTWTVKWGVGMPYSVQAAALTGATVTNGIARQNIQICLDTITAAIAGGGT